MGDRTGWWLAPWLLLAAAGQAAAVELVRRVFVGTYRGQLLETAALDGNTIGQSHIEGLVDTVLSAVTVVSLVTATIAIGFIALIRGRLALAAAATLLVVGANLTTQLLKQLTERPDFGVDLARAAAGNSFPSGHATVAASMAVALVLVLPPRLRGPAGLVGAGYAALAGVATLSAGWHRPSDAVAALLIVGGWAAAAGLVVAVVDRPDPAADQPRPHRLAVTTLAAAGLLLLALAGLAMVFTDQGLGSPVELAGRGRLFTAYAGGAAGIAGVTGLVMALVLATVHRTVPARAGGEAGSGRSGRRGGSATGRSAATAQPA